MFQLIYQLSLLEILILKNDVFCVLFFVKKYSHLNHSSFLAISSSFTSLKLVCPDYAPGANNDFAEFGPSASANCPDTAPDPSMYLAEFALSASVYYPDRAPGFTLYFAELAPGVTVYYPELAPGFTVY